MLVPRSGNKKNLKGRAFPCSSIFTPSWDMADAVRILLDDPPGIPAENVLIHKVHKDFTCSEFMFDFYSLSSINRKRKGVREAAGDPAVFAALKNCIIILQEREWHYMDSSDSHGRLFGTAKHMDDAECT